MSKRQQRRARRAFTPEFKAEAVRLCQVGDRSVGQVAEDLDLTETSLRDIPMLPMVKQALQQQFENRSPDNEYVFCSREGHPIDAHNFANRIWYPLLRFLGISVQCQRRTRRQHRRANEKSSRHHCLPY